LLTLEEQIDLFSNATHVIGVHGAGLTNLIHARTAAVLELFAENHGLRPDYFQIRCIHELP
jgi:capsular polysaccharide biosynthesis protein